MADFVAVLKKTIEGLNENTPEARDRVYSKARATIDAKLAALNPQPPAAVIARQRAAIDDAIHAVEAQYTPPAVVDEEDDLDSLFATYHSDADRISEALDQSSKPMPKASELSVQADEPVAAAPALPLDDDEQRNIDPVDARRDPSADVVDDYREVRPSAPRRSGRGVSGRLIAAGVALLLVASAGYGIWLNQDTLIEMAGLQADPSEVAEGTDGPEETNTENAIAASEALSDQSEPAADIADGDAPNAAAAAVPESSDGEGEQIAALDPNAVAPVSKFTQRLQEDGSEVDSGRSDTPSSIGEGTSVSELTQTAQAQLPAGDSATATDLAATGTAPTGTPAGQGDQAVAVGQRAIFYEERTAQAAGTAENGSIVWSVVQESPGGDAPPEPAIRAEATIPGRDIQLRMTIRRNADPTLPAGHIMEMIFLTPEGLEGGGFENLVRVALKDSEQSTGSPLMGIPAKIADGFFLVALSDSPAEIQTNLNMLRRENWLDVPLVYKSGRRALITLEKGIPGERVFEEVMRTWGGTESSG